MDVEGEEDVIDQRMLAALMEPAEGVADLAASHPDVALFLEGVDFLRELRGSRLDGVRGKGT